MLLSHKAFVPSTLLGKFLLAGIALFLGGMPVLAQPPGSPRISPEMRGYQRTMIWQNYYQRQAAAAQAQVAQPTYHAPAYQTEAPSGLQVVVSAPAKVAPTYVTLRGPNGVVRRFALEGGKAAIQTRSVIVRPGESVRITIMANR